jgi:antitoxin component of MazEF toxin-antitoxin module
LVQALELFAAMFLGNEGACDNDDVTVIRQTATLGPDGDLRIPPEIREAANVVDGEELLLEVDDDAAIVIRHVTTAADLTTTLARAARLRSRIAAAHPAVDVVREGRDELERRGNRAA